MKYFLLTALSISVANAIKILIAGDRTDELEPLFWNIAERLAQNQEHTVYFMTPTIQPVYKKKVSGNLINYGMSRTEQKFQIDPNQTEEENFFRLDLEHLQAYWQE